jgi:hypothetical protein
VRRWHAWLLLTVLSLLLHLAVSSRVGVQLGDGLDALEMRPAPAETPIVLVPETEEAPPLPEEKEPIRFEEDLDLSAPEIVLAPQAVVPPPANVPLTLAAQAGGAGVSDLPARVTLPDAALRALATDANVPAAGLLAPIAGGGRGGGAGGGMSGFGVGLGNALGGSSNRFAAYIADMRERGLDVLFVVDSTGSMGWVLEEVKTRINDIATVVRSLVPIARFGVVAYRDAQDTEFVVRAQPLTFSVVRVQDFLGSLAAAGGGDIFEAIRQGLEAAVDGAAWRPGARQLVILIGDAPPANADLSAIQALCARFAAGGGAVSTLDVSELSNPSLVEARTGRKVNRDIFRQRPMAPYRLIAEAGDGDAATLEGESTLTRRIVRLIVGDQFAREMRALIELM